MADYKVLGDDIIKYALKNGADEVEVYIEVGRESEVGTRLENLERLKEATSQGLGLRIFKDKRLGFAYTSDLSENNLKDFINNTIKLSDETTKDEFNGLPEPSSDIPELDLFDPKIEQIETSWKIDACKRMEKTMFDYDKHINNSEGACFLDGDSLIYIANSKGFYHSYKNSYCYLYCVPVAEKDGKLQSGFWFSFKRFFDELDSPETVANIAGERVIRMLGAITPKTKKVPVVFDPLTAGSFIGGLLSAINGDAIFKRATFLVDKLNQQIASACLNINDDGRLIRGVASAPIDGEGVPTTNKEIISEGVLRTYLYDTYTAKKAGVKSTANAQRSYSTIPEIGGFNFYLQAGDNSPEEIIGSVKDGLYLTNLMGYGANIVTGDYSRGASGIWIENGNLTRPVEGLTIASNMLEMLKNIEMVGNDLKMMGPVSSPTFKISEMIVAGS
jgi:PmbA protein